MAKNKLTSFQAILPATKFLKTGGIAITMNADTFVREAFIDASYIDRMANIRSFREPLMLSRDKVVIPAIAANFAAEGRPHWVMLSPVTIQNRMELAASGHILSASGIKQKPKTRGQRGRLSGGIRILDWSGRLKRASLQKNMWDVKDNQLIFRSTFFDQKVPYGKFHQLGTSKMPARVFISIRYSDEEKVKDIFDAWYTSRVFKYWILRQIRE